MPEQAIIGIVGPCAAGKSTLISGLAEHGITARHIAQEHSYVQDMWQRITHPDILIYLDVSFAESMQRRQMNWQETEFLEQVRRLQHARQHADFTLNTTHLSPQQVLQEVLAFLRNLPEYSK
jgi:deoxyadenosine/deoxycytidine kinase